MGYLVVLVNSHNNNYRFACCASVISVAIRAISGTDSCIPVAIQRIASANIPDAVKSET